MPRTIEKVRSELRHHDAKWKEAHARGDEFYVGYHTAMIAVLENERAALEKAEWVERLNFGDPLEANMHECPSKR